MGDIHEIILAHGVENARAMATNKAELRAVDVAASMLADEQCDMNLTHSGFAVAALPHKKIPETVWERNGGTIKLLVESGLDAQRRPVGIPYGSLARMILLYLQTQAVRSRSREVELGPSLNAWLRAMDIPAGGKTYELIREQSRRISRCRLTFFQTTEKAELVTNGSFVRDAFFPTQPTHVETAYWQERVRLDEGFFQSLMEHSLPLREAALRGISGRSMAIDIYIWLAYRLHALQHPVTVTWQALKGQFGQGYDERRFFRRDFQPNLKLALAAYPEAKVDVTESGVVLHNCRPPLTLDRPAFALSDITISVPPDVSTSADPTWDKPELPGPLDLQPSGRVKCPVQQPLGRAHPQGREQRSVSGLVALVERVRPELQVTAARRSGWRPRPTSWN